MSRLVFIFSLSLLAAIQEGCAGPLGPPLGLGPAFDPGMSVLIIVLIAACALVFARAFRVDFQRRHNRNSSQTEVQKILAERYARGEIGRDEYLEKSTDLQRSSV